MRHLMYREMVECFDTFTFESLCFYNVVDTFNAQGDEITFPVVMIDE